MLIESHRSLSPRRRAWLFSVVQRLGRSFRFGAGCSQSEGGSEPENKGVEPDLSFGCCRDVEHNIR